MLKALIARLRQGYRTMPYPVGKAVLPDRFRGKPEIAGEVGEADWRAASAACPTGAMAVEGGRAALDLGRCLFCADCTADGLLQLTGQDT
jgi:formate hydrogenlyase subunit 6/NADH:ubiquinone oxidoreductase subunit I